MSMKTTLIGFLLVLFSGLASTCQGGQSDMVPIASVGHGAMFDRDGKEIQVTPEFVRATQRFYLDTLLRQANEEQRALFEQKQKKILSDKKWDTRSELYATSALIDWMIKEVRPANAGELSGHNNLLQLALTIPGFQAEPSVNTNNATPFEVPGELKDLLIEEGLAESEVGDVALLSTTLGGAAYVNECNAAGVPTPPGWGTSQWVSQGVLENEFISAQREAEVFTYQSNMPEGMCFALPRSVGDTIQLLGIICLGKASGYACFWDNQNPANNSPFPIPKGKSIPLSQFVGGADLNEDIGGMCTDCHAGENPYVIHPNTVLGLPNLSGLPLRADKWYTPLVPAHWSQNTGPTNVLDSIASLGNCTTCHTQNGPGGRFPELSMEIPDYCNIILKQAINRTMPPSGPNDPSYAAHTRALLEACERPPITGPTAQLTVNKVLIPSLAPGAFNLQIDGVTFATNVGDGGSTGPKVVNVGAHTVGETTQLSSDGFTAVIGGDCAPDGSITLAEDDKKTCTITNTLTPIGVCRLECMVDLDACLAEVGEKGEPTAAVCQQQHLSCQQRCSSLPPAHAQLTITKILIPAEDSGRFNLLIDGEIYASNIGNGGSTGSQALLPGTHTVGEAAGSGTSLANYTTVIGGDCAQNGTITLAPGDNKTCTITNTVLPPAYLTVIKVVRPLGDPGLFDLRIDGATVLTNAGNGASTGPVTVSPGTHRVGEVAAPGTILDNYVSVIGGDCAWTGTITLVSGDNKTCTITNTLNEERVACLAECQANLDACLAAVGEEGEPTAAVCGQQMHRCTDRCSPP